VKHRPPSVTDLGGRYGLPPKAIARLGALAEILAGEHAPTAVRGPEAVLNDHLADSLVALDLECVRSATRIADLGAGAGLPGLPLAISLPDAEAALVESNARKCDFLRRTCEACSVGNAEVVNARAEEWRDGAAACDLVVARAVAPLAVVAEYAAPLLRVGGSLVAWRGRRDVAEEALAAAAAAQLGLELLAPVSVVPYPGALHRHLHVVVKTGPTPPRFPRRAGVARKRPLGGPASDRARR